MGTLAFRQMMDDRHRAQGRVICWCGRWYAPDELVDGTCGAVECVRAEAADRAGLVP